MRRRNVPCSPCSGGSSSGDCCGLKEKLRILWNRTIGSILRINGISPDGDGDFTIEAGDNIEIIERGTGNGLRIATTGGVSYYSGDGQYIDVDNNNLKISAIVGTGGLAKDSDIQTISGAVTNILNGTSTVPNATNAVTAQRLPLVTEILTIQGMQIIKVTCGNIVNYSMQDQTLPVAGDYEIDDAIGFYNRPGTLVFSAGNVSNPPAFIFVLANKIWIRVTGTGSQAPYCGFNCTMFKLS